jgi:hypothetical protein
MNTESESNSEAEAYFDSQCNHKHSWGLPEIVIPCPEMKLTIEELYERAVDVLNEYPMEMNELLDQLCDEGTASFDVVTYIGSGRFQASGEGCLISCSPDPFEVTLNSTLDAEGIHVVVEEGTMVYLDEEPWE